MSDKNKKDRQAALLGMPVNTARNKLAKLLLFECLIRMNLNQCSRCGRIISSPSDLTIEHIHNWESNPELYWDVNNIRISCVECPGNKNEVKIMSELVDVRLVDENGRSVRSTTKNGKIYFIGMKGERYRIEVTNKTARRVEAVVTVDGLDVISGEAGNYSKQGGYVIGPNQSCVIDGWRRNMREVAAFRFTKDEHPAENSYAALKGMPQNMGMIGVAVFKEALPVFHPIIKSFPTPCRSPWIQPRTNFPIWHHGPRIGGIAGQSTTGGTYNIPDVYYGASSASGSSFVSSRPLDGDIEVTCSLQGSPNGTPDFISPEIGTEYGEVVGSSCEYVSFSRNNFHQPDAIIELEYDTEQGLIDRGILIPTPAARNPFPGITSVEVGFAQPPKKN